MNIPESSATLYSAEIGRFSELLKTNREYAFERYGWCYIYSLPPEERHQLRHELGWEDRTALDFYNTGTMECRAGRIDEGLPHLEKAREMGLNIPELWLNLGLAYDQKQDMKNVKECWQKFVEELELRVRVPAHYGDDLDEVRERLAQM